LVCAFFAVIAAVSLGLAVTLMRSSSLPGISLPKTFASTHHRLAPGSSSPGVLLAIVVPTGARAPRWLAEVLGVVGILMLGVAAVRMNAASGVPGLTTLLPVSGPSL
jgi:peptidoglycan/LPS O-acetylase OafA/YrhL